MPLTEDAWTIYGGCNCGSIRYRVNIPPLSERALRCTPAASPADIAAHGTEVRFPMIILDHCNDCRHATGGFLTAYLTADVHTTAFAFGPPVKRAPAPAPASAQTQGQGQGQGEKETATTTTTAASSAPAPQEQHWIPCTEVLTPGRPHTVPGSPLRSYESSPGIRRAFCGTCGTNLTFHADVAQEGFTEMLDLLLGTVDREYLDGLRPERHVLWDFGVDWVKELTGHGVVGAVPKHPGDDLAKFIVEKGGAGEKGKARGVGDWVKDLSVGLFFGFLAIFVYSMSREGKFRW